MSVRVAHRSSLVSGDVSSDEYWLQFVTPDTVRFVTDGLGEDVLFAAAGSVGGLDGIAGRRWDALVRSGDGEVLLPFDRVAFERSGEFLRGVSLLFLSSVAKAAARVVVGR